VAKPKKRKSKTSKSIINRLPKVAVQANKRAAKASAVLKKNRKTYRNAGKAILGIGAAPKKKRAATKGDILRKGKSLLRRNAAALARFIALRYSPKAIAKYQDYAGRLKRSKRLIKQIRQIDANTFRIRQHIIKTDTAGEIPYSCTCPDFSQFSDDDRNWLGSKAGPFNPCKHMMAVRDRSRDGKWVCDGAVCTLNPLATTGYDTKAACEAKIRPAISGGQCIDEPYNFFIFWDLIATENYPDLGIVAGDIVGSSSRSYGCAFGGLDDITGANVYIYGPIDKPVTLLPPDVSSRQIRFNCHNGAGLTTTIGISVAPLVTVQTTLKIGGQGLRCDGLAECGDLALDCDIPDFTGCTDPAANNYNPFANTDDGSCTYTILGCTDPAANNYDPLANTDDGSCTYDVYGCTDPEATNYNPDATIDDGSCTY
jgi:hypothetical protein